MQGTAEPGSTHGFNEGDFSHQALIHLALVFLLRALKLSHFSLNQTEVTFSPNRSYMHLHLKTMSLNVLNTKKIHLLITVLYL